MQKQRCKGPPAARSGPPRTHGKPFPWVALFWIALAIGFLHDLHL